MKGNIMLGSNYKYSSSDLINICSLPYDQLIKGEKDFNHFISGLVESHIEKSKNSSCRIASESHHGMNWEYIITKLESILIKQGVKPIFINMEDCLKAPKTVDKIVKPYLTDDPTFGKIYNGKLSDLFDDKKLEQVKKKLGQLKSPFKNNCIICYGPGSALGVLRRYFDYLFYFDLCREEILKRFKMGLVKPIGMKGVVKSTSEGIPAYFSTKRLYYIDYPVMDKHRKDLLLKVDYYVDGNVLGEPKLIPGNIFRDIISQLIQGPIKPKPYYDPSPWGGQWLKKIRTLPKKMKNCAWSYDLIEPETSFQVKLGETILEFPFSILVNYKPKELMGSKGCQKKFKGQFPVRINYDDGYKGDHMALQCHPDNSYIRKNFNEPYRQDGSYYVVDSLPGSTVHLGLKEDINIEEFRKAVIRAEKKSIPFDHKKYINALPTKKGDLFLIPAGTLHGSGSDETVLEISATTYRYTFHFYDFLRPGLDGKLRPIHSKHAFNALKTYRKTNWVEKNLKQKPRLIKKAKGFAEYLLGHRKDMFFKVHRLEFEKTIRDNTKGEFHLLILVEGESVRIIPKSNKKLNTDLPFSCLAVIPAHMGEYKIEGLGEGPYKVVKVLMA